jgi:integrase
MYAEQTDLFANPTSDVKSSETTNVASPVVTKKDDTIPTLAAYTDKIAHRIWRKEHTRNSSLRAVRLFSEHKNYGQLTLAQISRKHIYDFVEHLIDERGISENTGNRYLAAISRVMREANEKEVVDNPIKLKYASVKSARPRWFSESEQAAMVQYLRDLGKDYMAEMVIMSCNTGMRKSEILAITHPDAELTDDGKWLFLPAEVIKTGEDRYIPMNAKAQAAYHKLLSVTEYKRKGHQPKYRKLIEGYSHRGFYDTWTKLQRDVGKGDANFVFHVCRHTAATRLANDVKANSFQIADILGHKSERTTRRYVHAKKSALLDAVGML